MAYRYDCDLEFLKKVHTGDLVSLVSVLTHDLKDGKPRHTETLTSSSEYKRYSPNHTKYWERIAEEIQCFGGNTAANLLRWGKGVEYKEILMDVCDVLKVNYNKKLETHKIEEQLLAKMLEVALEKMSYEEKKTFLRNASATISITQRISNATGFMGLMASSSSWLAYGISSLVPTMFVHSALSSSGLAVGGFVASMVTRQVMTETAIYAGGRTALAAPLAAFAMPLAVLLTGYQIAGPAYRVTIPVCLCIAELRKKVEMTSVEVMQVKKRNKAFEELAGRLRNCQEIEKEVLGRFILLRETAKALGLDNATEMAWTMLNLSPKLESKIQSLAKERSFKNLVNAVLFVHEDCLLGKDYIQGVVAQLCELIECEAELSYEEYQTEDVKALISQTLALV